MQSAVLLMPWLQITGDRFVSVAMEINREAEQIAAGKARGAGAYEVTDNYERGTSMREAKAKEYQQKADEALHGRQDSIDGLHLAGWCLSSGADLAFEGIQVREGYSLRTSDDGAGSLLVYAFATKNPADTDLFGWCSDDRDWCGVADCDPGTFVGADAVGGAVL